MIYELSRKYRPILQLPYCCVPAILQWILYRRGLDILDQEFIGVCLGLRLPSKGKILFANKDIIYTDKEPETGYGTQIENKKYSIQSFFEKYRIPLAISEMIVTNNSKELNELLIDQLSMGNDIILRYNNAITKLPDTKNYGHFSVISRYNSRTKEVRIGDPEMPFFKTVTLDQIVYATSKEIDGIQRGIYIVSSYK